MALALRQAGENTHEPFDMTHCSRVSAFPLERILHPLKSHRDSIIPSPDRLTIIICTRRRPGENFRGPAPSGASSIDRTGNETSGPGQAGECHCIDPCLSGNQDPTDPPPARAFDQFALPHLDAAYNLARWLVKDVALAEDVVQDSYLRAYCAFDRCRSRNVKPWILAIVRNGAYSRIRDRARRCNVVSLDSGGDADEEGCSLSIDIVSSEPSPEACIISKDESAMLMRALSDLPPMFREVLILRELEELSYAEIATVIGVPVGTVMSRLARARERLLAVLAARQYSPS